MSTKANWIGATDYNSKISKMQDKGRVNVRKRESKLLEKDYKVNLE